jgi:hypothetical protein
MNKQEAVERLITAVKVAKEILDEALPLESSVLKDQLMLMMVGATIQQ